MKLLKLLNVILSLAKNIPDLDEISLAILEAVADCKGYSISEITRKVKNIRGKASRRIISSRVKKLEKRGLLINKGNNIRPRYVLTTCQNT